MYYEVYNDDKKRGFESILKCVLLNNYKSLLAIWMTSNAEA